MHILAWLDVTTLLDPRSMPSKASQGATLFQPDITMSLTTEMYHRVISIYDVTPLQCVGSWVLYLSSLAAVSLLLSYHLDLELAILQHLTCIHHDGTKPFLALTDFVAY